MGSIKAAFGFIGVENAPDAQNTFLSYACATYAPIPISAPCKGETPESALPIRLSDPRPPANQSPTPWQSPPPPESLRLAECTKA